MYNIFSSGGPLSFFFFLEWSGVDKKGLFINLYIKVWLLIMSTQPLFSSQLLSPSSTAQSVIDWWCPRAVSESIEEILGEKWYPFIWRVINECFSSRLSGIDPLFTAGSIWSAEDHISSSDQYKWLAHKSEYV